MIQANRRLLQSLYDLDGSKLLDAASKVSQRTRDALDKVLRESKF